MRCVQLLLTRIIPTDHPLISVFHLASRSPPASVDGLISQDLIIIHAAHFLPESNLFLRCKKMCPPLPLTLPPHRHHFPQKLHLCLVETPSLSECVMGEFEVLLWGAVAAMMGPFMGNSKARESEAGQRRAGLQLSGCRVAS